jgi:acetyl esterase
MSGRGRLARIGIDPAFSWAECTAGKIDPAAAGVIALLSHKNAPFNYHLAQTRRRYEASRKPLLADKETVESVFHVSPSEPDVPSMTFWRPDGIPAGPLLPALVYLHGGGWTLGGLETYESLCRQITNATGRVVIWVSYRLAPEHPFPAALEDTWKALDWIAANAGWIGIDKDQIAIAGDSSGGNLAAVTAIAASNGIIAFRPQFQLLIYPCLDLTASQPSHSEFAEGHLLTRELYAWYRKNYIGSFRDPADWRLSPLFAEELRGVAPAIVLYAGFDPLRDEAVVYSARLLDAGVCVKPISFPGMIHGFLTMGKAIPAANDAVRRIAAAIDKVLEIRPHAKRDFASTSSVSSFDASSISAHLQMQGDI